MMFNKITKIGISIILVASIVFLFTIINKSLQEKNYFEKISLEELEDKMKDNEESPIYIYIYKNDCNACNRYKKVLNTVIEQKNIIVYALDFSNPSDVITDFRKKHNLNVTPTTMIFFGVQEKKRFEGYMGEEDLMKFININ